MSLELFLPTTSCTKIYFGADNTSLDLDDNEEALDLGVVFLTHPRNDFTSLASFLKLHSLTRATQAVDATVVDIISLELRFHLIYIVHSEATNTRYIFSTWASETRPAVSLQSIYPAFNWAEREIWDMFGLFVVKHPNLRRILTDYGFIGHPLRKDFPLTGFKEVQYEDQIKHVEYSQTELVQSFRVFSHKASWVKK